jgi:hypothetical protein
VRRACAKCHVPLYGDRPGIRGEEISHGLCDVCGVELYGELWRGRSGATRWPGVRLRVALRRAGHSRRDLAAELGVPHARVIREAEYPRLSWQFQRMLMDSKRGVYYHALTAPVGV